MSTVEVRSGEKRSLNVNGEDLEIIPLGAGSEVGRSCCILKLRGKTVMFDCGIHPAYSGMSSLPYFDNIDPGSVDLCLVTHFHLDHSGAVPYFVNKTAFKGRVFMTHPTKPICRFLWQDSFRVSKIASEDQIYNRQDIEKTLQRIELIDFHQEFEHDGIKFSCYGAGHVLGAAMFLVEVEGIRVLYTGDYSREVDKHLPSAEIPEKDVHVLIVESTYGVQNHEPRDQRESRFTNLVHQIVRQGGKCLLPVFALGRAQELLLILEDYWKRNPDLHQIPIYYNSPMTNKCMRIFETYTGLCSSSVQDLANDCQNPWYFKFVQDLVDPEELDAGPCVVMAAPGMLQSGASRDLFEMWASDKRNGVILTGYCVAGTPAYDLKSEPDSLTLSDGRKTKIACTVKFLSFSAHSDFQQTSTFIDAMKTPNVVLVHGEANGMQALARKLRDDYPDLNVCTPKNCESTVFKFAADAAVQEVGSLAEKRPKQLQGLLLESPDGSRLLVNPEELPDFMDVSVATLQQSQRIPVGDITLSALDMLLRTVFDDVLFDESGLTISKCVHVAIREENLEVSWTASPVSDMTADCVVFMALDMSKKSDKGHIRSPGDDELLKVLTSYANLNYEDVTVVAPESRLKFRLEDTTVVVDVPKREVECEDGDVKSKVLEKIRMLEEHLKPVKY